VRFGLVAGVTRHGYAVVNVEYGERDSVGLDEKEVVNVMGVDRLELGWVGKGMDVGV